MSAIESKPLYPNDICVYINYKSKVHEIVKRHRNEEEEKIYQATLNILYHPYAEIDKDRVLVGITHDTTNCHLYLMVRKSLHERTMVMLAQRKSLQSRPINETRTSLFLSSVLHNSDTLQELHTYETVHEKHVF